MSDIERDLGHLRNLRLTPEEKAVLRAELLQKLPVRMEESQRLTEADPSITLSMQKTITSFGSFKGLCLTAEERSEGAASLRAFMAANPVRTRTSFRWAFFMVRFPAMAIVTLVIVTTLGGAAYAAENSVPGDKLYGLKVGFNEPLIGLLAVTGEDRAKQEVWRLERRLREAEALRATGRGSTDADAQLHVAVAGHYRRAEELVNALRAQEGDAAIRLADQLEAVIVVHEDTLMEASTPEDIHGSPLLQNILVIRENARAVRERAEEELPAPQRMDRMHQRMQNLVEEQSANSDTSSAAFQPPAVPRAVRALEQALKDQDWKRAQDLLRRQEQAVEAAGRERRERMQELKEGEHLAPEVPAL